VPSYAAPEAAVRALARVVTYSQWVNRPAASNPKLDVRSGDARAEVVKILADSPTGRDLTDEELSRLLAAYGIELQRLISVSTLSEAVSAGRELGWDVVLKATAEHLRQRPDLAHVWRSIDTKEEMAHAWNTLHELIDEPEDAGFVVQKMGPPGIPITMGSLEDALFGPIVSFGMAGTASDLLGDVSYRIPPLNTDDAGDLVRDVRAAPLFFGYRGSEAIDVRAVEDLIQRLARLKDDLPEVQQLDLGLVLASADGASVLRAFGRVCPVEDARSDWFARRLTGPTSTDDTLVTG
jgi:hypothetical protein